MIAYLPPCNQKTTPNFKRGFFLHSGLKPLSTIEYFQNINGILHLMNFLIPRSHLQTDCLSIRLKQYIQSIIYTKSHNICYNSNSISSLVYIPYPPNMFSSRFLYFSYTCNTNASTGVLGGQLFIALSIISSLIYIHFKSSLLIS